MVGRTEESSHDASNRGGETGRSKKESVFAGKPSRKLPCVAEAGEGGRAGSWRLGRADTVTSGALEEGRVGVPRLCHRCGADVGSIDRVGRRDTCLQCGSDLHCCRNCRFYDRGYNNQCREQQAEPQVEKEQGNFCEYFAFREGGCGRTTDAAKQNVRSQLDALFRKDE